MREREREREREGALRCLISSFYKTSTESIVHKKRAHLSTIVNRNRRYIIIIKSGRDHSANYRNLSTHTRAYTCTKKKWHIHHTHIHIYAKKKRRNIDNSKLYIERTLSNKFYRVVSGKLVIVFMRPSARKRYNNMIIQKKKDARETFGFSTGRVVAFSIRIRIARLRSRSSISNIMIKQSNCNKTKYRTKAFAKNRFLFPCVGDGTIARSVISHEIRIRASARSSLIFVDI